MGDDIFWETINESTDPVVLADGPGWLLARLVPGVYEAVIQNDGEPMIPKVISLMEHLPSNVILYHHQKIGDDRTIINFLQKDQR